jgi:hypothetical protein
MVHSPLANLGAVLRIVRESAVSYGPTLRKNEAATRAVLVDPVLRALGWDVANPFKVEVETPGFFGTNKVSADYALKANGEVMAVIEAKRLGTDLTLFHHQLVQYSFSFGIEKLFLTDGLHWEHFTDFKPGDLSPSNTLNIGSDDLGQVAAYLVQELDAALISPEEEQLNVLAEQVEQIQEEVTKLRSLEHRIRQFENADTNKSRASSPSGEVSPESVSSLWRPLSSLSNVKGTKPSAFRLPNSQEIPVKTWGQVLFETCRYALTAHPDLHVPLPDKAGKKTTLIQEAAFPSNINSKEIEVRDQTLHVYVNYDASNCVANAAYVLELVPDSVKPTPAAVVYS